MMFANKTAWFSESCYDNSEQQWVQNGGQLADVTLAQYIFSDDIEHSDTTDLCSSEAYLKQHLAVFSSRYVLDAVHDGVDQVSLGKYFLIPKELQERMKRRGVSASMQDSRKHRNRSDVDRGENEPDHSSAIPITGAGQTGQPNRRKNGSKVDSTEDNMHGEKFETGSLLIDLTQIRSVQGLPKAPGPLYSVYPGKDGVAVEYLNSGSLS